MRGEEQRWKIVSGIINLPSDLNSNALFFHLSPGQGRDDVPGRREDVRGSVRRTERRNNSPLETPKRKQDQGPQRVPARERRMKQELKRVHRLRRMRTQTRPGLREIRPLLRVTELLKMVEVKLVTKRKTEETRRSRNARADRGEL